MSTTQILPDGRTVTLLAVNRKGREHTRYEVYTDGQRIGAVASGFYNGENARGGLVWITTSSPTPMRSRKYAIDFLLRDHLNGVAGDPDKVVIA